MKIGVAQVNPTVGDLLGNLEIIQDAYHSLVQSGAELVIFPELVICGYPPRDLLLKKILDRTALTPWKNFHGKPPLAQPLLASLSQAIHETVNLSSIPQHSA